MFGVALLALGAAAGTGYGQTCHVTCPDGTSLPISCDTKIDPCPMRDLATPPLTGSPEWNAIFGRFTDVLTRLRALEPLLLKEQPAPISYAELARESGVMFEDAAFDLDSVNLRNRWLAEQLRNQDQELQGLTSRENELRKRSVEFAGEMTVAKAEFTRARSEAENRRMPALSVQRAANAMRDRAKRAAQDCIYWLAVAEPPGVTPIREGMLGTRIVARQDQLVWTQERPESAVVITPYAATPGEFTEIPVRRSIPPGSAADRLAVAEGLIPQLTDAEALLQRNETALAQKSRTLGPARARVATLLVTVMRNQGELNGLRASTVSLRTTSWKDLQLNQVRALGNLRRAAAEAFVLETYRDRVLIPEVRVFLSANRVTRSLDHAALVRIYETKTNLLPLGNRGAYAELNRYLNVQQRTARILSDYRLYAGDAAAMIGTDASYQAQSIRSEVNRNLGSTRHDLLLGAEHDSGPLAKIARALLAP